MSDADAQLGLYPDDEEFVDAPVEEQPQEPSEEVTEPAKDPVAAAQADMDFAERRKRQEAERESAELRERLARIEGQLSAGRKTEEPEEEVPAFDISDLDGSTVSIARHIAERIADERERKRLEHEEAVWAAHAQDSINDARERHEDWDEKWQVYREMERDDPKLAAISRRVSDPAEWAYQKAAKKMQGNPRVSELEKEVARLKALVGEEQGPAPPKPKTKLAGARSSGAKSTGPVLTDADAFDDALDGR
jgi:hypothetical protein